MSNRISKPSSGPHSSACVCVCEQRKSVWFHFCRAWIRPGKWVAPTRSPIRTCETERRASVISMSGVGQLLAIALLVASAVAAPQSPGSNSVQPSAIEEGIETAYKWVQGCGEKDMSLCLKMRALTYVDRQLRRPDDISIFEGVSLVRTEAASRENFGRAVSEDELDASLPKDAETKDAEVESMLVDRVARFLQTHTLQLKVPDSSIQEVRRSLDEARGKKKKLKMLLPLLLMLKLKAAAIIPLALGALALLALKALIVGKLALVLSGLIGLQKLLSSKHQTQSYEVVAHPHYSEEHHGHYRRSLGSDQAYSAYAPTQ